MRAELDAVSLPVVAEGTARGGSRMLVWLLRAVVALVILAYLFRVVPAGRVLSELTRALVPWIVAGLALSLSVQWVVSVRLKRLAGAQGLGLSVTDALHLNLATRFYGLFVPGGTVTATAIRVYRLGQVRRQYAAAAAAVALDRVLATMTLCAVGIVFWLLDWPPHSHGWLLLMVGALAAISAPVALFFVLRPTPARDGSPRRLSGLAARFDSLRNAALQVRRMPARDLVVALALSVASHLLGIAAYAAVAAALDLHVEISAIGWIRTALLLATLIPVSFAGLGLREAAALLVLPAYGIDAHSSMAFSLLIFAATALGVGLVGGLFEGWRWLGGSADRNERRVS